MTRAFKLDDIDVIAAEFWKAAGEAKIFLFHGAMGAGKTTFITALCHALGVRDGVSSPTFSLVNEYRYIKNGVEGTAYHMDLYRLKDAEEAIGAGIEDCLQSGAVCFVEWPERAPGLFDDDAVEVELQVIDERTRKLTLGTSNRFTGGSVGEQL